MFQSRPLRNVAFGMFWVAGVVLNLQFGWGQEFAPHEIEFFEKHVRPLLTEHCYECHAGKESNGGLRLDSRESTRRGGDSGPSLVLHNPGKSRLIEAVRYTDRDLQMPPAGPLGADQVDVLVRWVAMGAPDPRVAASGATDSPTGMSIEEGRRFWSMKPIGESIIPSVRHQDWVRTPVDAFVLEQLEARGLTPAPVADKRTLIRRATLDLLGLPPTLEEIDAFEADDDPQAFSKLVDRLLESPQYGERWGRHWLDVARYADSNGLDENIAFGTAWRYRDYVVDSLNRDKPFDQFVIEQIAGDLVPNGNRETKTATGFLSLGAKVLAEPDLEKLSMDTIDEQLDAIGKAFLGMTLGCARCHDHKFDPIKQSDYYGLAAILKSTKTFGDTNFGAIKHWNEHAFGSDEEKERLKVIEGQIAEKQKAAASYRAQAMGKIREEAQQKIVEYLIAAAMFSPDTPLNEIALIGQPNALHPRILHQCRLYLAYQSEHPLFQKWHELASRSDVEGIALHYRPLFERAAAAWKEAKERDPNAVSLDDPELEQVRKAIVDPAGLIVVPAKPAFAFDEATLAPYNRLAEEARVLESFAPDATSAMGVTDGKLVAALPIHIRGSHRNLGESIPRQFPAVMRTSVADPIFRRAQSGRLELAHWIADASHPLTARVYVNRLWRWHFGFGIVGSTENFGKLGDRPSHPELLDWLARYFVESGWSTKAMHRLIMGSQTYQMASLHPDEADSVVVDADNRWMWKFRMQRMDAEQVRDSILAVSQRLDERMGGKSIPLRNRQFVFDHTSIDHTKYDSLRRAIYLPIVRNNLYTLFEQFDFPDPTMPTGHRQTTTVAPQALWLMNSDLMLDSAQAMAKGILAQSSDPFVLADRVYLLTLGRRARPEEAQRIVAFIAEAIAGQPIADREHQEQRAWGLVCQSLLASNEFLYVR